jgi:glutathione S-transferase
MWTLYFRPGTCAMASYLALEEAGASYRAIDMTDRIDELKTLNPRGKVPALEIDGQILRENIAIIDLVANRLPEAELLPRDDLARAQCMSTLAWFASTLHIDYRRFLKPQVYEPSWPGAQAGVSREGARQYRLDLQELDDMLKSGGEWLHGNSQRTAVDLYGLVFVDWAVRSKLYDPAWRSIAAWVDRLRDRAAVARVLELTGSPLMAGVPTRIS